VAVLHPAGDNSKYHWHESRELESLQFAKEKQRTMFSLFSILGYKPAVFFPGLGHRVIAVRCGFKGILVRMPPACAWLQG